MNESGRVSEHGSDARPDRRRANARLALALVFVAALTVYLTAFTLAGEPLPRHWVYGTDTTEPGLRILENPDRWALYHFRRRPLFVAASAPVFELGRTLFGGLGEPSGSNLALALGPALAGAIALLVAWGLLRRVCAGSGLAAPALLLYATAGSTVFFSAYPESGAAGALAANLFLSGLMRWPADAVRRPAIANCAAAMVFPPLVLLASIPCLRYLRSGFRAGAGRAARYAAVLVAAYLLPMMLVGGIEPSGYAPSKMGTLFTEFGKSAAAERNDGLRSRPSTWTAIAANHAAYAFVTPRPEVLPDTDIKTETHPSTGAILKAPAAYQVVAWPIFAAIAIGAILAFRRPPPSLPFAREILGFALAYCLLIGCVNPSEPFLYVAPLTLPLLLVVSAALSRLPRTRSMHVAAWVLAMGSAAANLRLVLFLRTLL